MTRAGFESKVDGMICPQCEDEIAQRLIHTRGILNADSNYRRSYVNAEYDKDLITEDEIKEILASIGYPVGSGRSGLKSDILGLIGVVVIFFGIKLLGDIVKVPALEEGTSFLMIFLIGLATGVHCIGMCGGIMLGSVSLGSLGSVGDNRNSGTLQTSESSNTPKDSGKASSFALRTLEYNGSRLASYTAVGAVCGAIGGFITYDTQFKSMLFTICGVLVVLLGLMMWGVPFLRRISPTLTKPCSFGTEKSPVIIGLLTGLMPCGALSTMWIYAASRGSVAEGALAMFAFGLGTCVLMLAFGLLGVFIPKKYNKYILKVSTVLIVSLGLVLISKGLTLVL